MARKVTVIKSSGEEEEFSEAKLKRSLRNAGALNEAIDKVLKEVKTILKSGMTTKEIYKKAFKVLKKADGGIAGRYNLKHSLFEFGPSGYPFEEFIGDLFIEQGYKVEVGKVVMGKCVSHEVDVVAKKKDRHALVECKFHNSSGLYSSVKVPLYVKSRFDDLNECAREGKHGTCHFHEGFVITNTRFSGDAMAYGQCRGLKLISWNYPRGQGIEKMIDRFGIHPITCLTKLTKKEARILLKDGVTSCKALRRNPDALKKLRIRKEKRDLVLQEAQDICAIKGKK